MLLILKAPELFSFNGCKFGVRRCKESTGRVVFWRQFAIEQSFTLEVSFSGIFQRLADADRGVNTEQKCSYALNSYE